MTEDARIYCIQKLIHWSKETGPFRKGDMDTDNISPSLDRPFC